MIDAIMRLFQPLLDMFLSLFSKGYLIYFLMLLVVIMFGLFIYMVLSLFDVV
jgi:hypothetical protein